MAGKTPCVMLSAGEASGDLHGATLSSALGRLAPDWRLIGMGGPRMAAAGVDILADVTPSSPIGLTEPVAAVPSLVRAFVRLVRALRAERPRALVLIDFPDFNLPLAIVARRLGIPLVYFVPPDIWAWRPGRGSVVSRLGVYVLAVFPFEPPIYGAETRVDFVGHPILDVLPRDLTRAEARKALGVPQDATLVGLLPGSRPAEITRLLPAMMRAADLIHARRPDVYFRMAPAVTVDRRLVDRFHSANGTRIGNVQGRNYELMAAADLLLVASGTATLEAALLQTPMVVCYRLSALSARLGRFLQRVPRISLANIVCGGPVVPELLQSEATGERLAVEAVNMLERPEEMEAQREAFRKLDGTLGGPGAGVRAAERVLQFAGYPR